MKTIGLLGGMSWESTLEYYRLINEITRQRLGGLHSSRCLLYSVDFAEIEPLQHQGRWDELAGLLADAARSLERGGADCLVLCTNTMHLLSGALQSATRLPLLHIADAAGAAIHAAGLQRVGLLGTRFTMEQDFYRQRLAHKFGLQVLIPPEPQRQVVHRVIYDELCLGVINPASREAYAQIMADLISSGAQGIILGCTEIELLVSQADCPAPVFPTTFLHAQAAVDFALAD